MKINSLIIDSQFSILDSRLKSFALIIFIRNPVIGKVKTRLAAEIGNTKALELYLRLLQHTFDVTVDIPVEKYVYYSDFIPEDDMWKSSSYSQRIQTGKDLGDRMSNAINEAFFLHDQVVVIGSDCADLDTNTITTAFESLNSVDVVIGPAKDGGYYLIGFKTFYPTLFEGISWSTQHVFQQTRAQLLELKLNFKVLKTKTDIDTLADAARLGWNVSE